MTDKRPIVMLSTEGMTREEMKAAAQAALRKLGVFRTTDDDSGDDSQG